MQKPEDLKNKLASKRSLEEVEQKEESKEGKEEKKVSKVEKEKPKKQASAETLSVICENLFIIQDISNFINNQAITSDKRGQYCIQLNTVVLGEAARQVMRLLEINEEHMPRACKEMPWDKLIYLRTACTHKFHLQNLEQLIKAIKSDIPALGKIAAKMKTLIEKSQHEKKEHEQAPLKLATIDTYINLINETEQKKKAEKSKDESRKDKNIDKLAKQVKGLKIIIDELNNIKTFLDSGKDDVTLYAVQMAMINMGLAVSDRLDKEFQAEHMLQINIPGNQPFTWKNLISIREITTHQNYKMDAQRIIKESTALQSAFYFFQELYEQQNAKLTRLKADFHQKQQAEKTHSSRELDKDKTSSSQPTTLDVAKESFKSFTLLKAQPKMKASGFVNPLVPPVPPVAAKIPLKQSASSDIKVDNNSLKPGKKI